MRDAKTATALAVRPFVDLFIQDDDDQPIAGIRIKNEGPGVGTIKDVTYYVDRKLVGDQDAAIKRFNIASGKIRYTSFDEGDNLAVNDDPWLFYMRRHQVTKQQFESFIDFIDNHVAVKVKFCSAQGECWTKCSTPGMC
jgi:hypothetical protein